MNVLSKIKINSYSVYSALRARGLVTVMRLIAVAIRDRSEDRALGLEAHDFLDTAFHTRGHPNAPFANYYQPTRSIPFRELLSILRPDANFNFVDIGAGTGKAMLLAAEYGYRCVRGVELVKELCDVAENNFKRFQKNFPHARYEMKHADALEFSLNEGDAFFFLNDPFSEEVFRPFLERIKEFSKSVPHEILLVYKNNNLRQIPSLAEFVDHCSNYSEFDINGNFFQVYKIKGAAAGQTSIS